MKAKLSLILLLVFNQQIQAQMVERSLTAGSRSEASIVKPYGDDKWIIAGRGVPEPGATDWDTLFIAIITDDGQIVFRKNIATSPADIHRWYDLLVLPDGGIIANFESGACDYYGVPSTVQRLDAQGNLLWEFSGSINDKIPEKWFISPSGNLIGASIYQVWNVDLNTGGILSRIDLQGINSGNIKVYELQYIPDSEDFFAMGNPDIQLWHKSGSSTFPKYTMINSLDSLGFAQRMKPGPDGWFYYLNFSPFAGYDQFERINYNMQHETLFQIDGPSYLFQEYEISGSNLYYATGENNMILKKFDLLSKEDNEVLVWESRRGARSLAARNGLLALSGVEMLGEINATPWFAQSSAAWFCKLHESSPTIEVGKSNATITAIEQLQPIDFVQVNIPWQGVNYNVFGGHFKIKVTNEGSKVLDNVNINIALGRNFYFDLCLSYSTQQKRFYNLNLPVGESVWVDFGEILADGQAEIPAEICFWTSSPNEEPDADYENDRACHLASYTVAIKDPNISQVVLFPNPSDDFTELALTEKMEGEPWRIFDATGRVVSSGINTDDKTLRVETAHLPNGFYLLSLKNRVGKLVVQH